MNYKIWIILGGFIFALVLVTCCPENEVLYPPEGTLRYWDEHDTIVFYSTELDKFEIYPVCTRDFVGTVYELHDRCGSYIQAYAAQYRIRLDSCENVEYFTVRVTPDKYITVIRIFGDGTGVNDGIYIPNAQYTSVEILGRTYNKVYQIDYNPPFDSISTVYVTLEHGIIQYRFDNCTFNLINDEI